MDNEPLSTEELIAQMERDEAEGASKLSPREYARLRGKAPQLIYYYIRKHKIKMEVCVCGRNVIDVEAADAFFGRDSAGAAEDAEEDQPEA